MSEQQPTGITVYHDGQATNYPSANDLFVNTGTLHIREENTHPRSDAIFANPGIVTIAMHAPGKWDSVERHPARPGKVTIVLPDGDTVTGYVR